MVSRWHNLSHNPGAVERDQRLIGWPVYGSGREKRTDDSVANLPDLFTIIYLSRIGYNETIVYSYPGTDAPMNGVFVP